MSIRGKAVRSFILHNVEAHPTDITKLVMKGFGITRQAVGLHMRQLIAQGAISVTGKTSDRRYKLAPMVTWRKSYEITSDLQEDLVWRDDVAPILKDLPPNVVEMWAHGFTEMLNNARDHSEGRAVSVSVLMTAVTTEMAVTDDGVGIFRKIQQAKGLLDERHAIFELAKGKLTTDPSKHSGEGIFFTSRIFDDFDIHSGGVFYHHDAPSEDDWLLERSDPKAGTMVLMKLSNRSKRTTKEVFDQYSSGADDYGFTKTVVPVKLAQYGNDKLISRSQAKRVMARVDLFQTVVLNFEAVPTIGQAFADEIFRVFQLSHPQIRIVPINTSSEINQMISRARGALHSAAPGEVTETES